MKRQPPLHPVLFTVFPVVFLYAHNLREDDVTLGALVWPIVESMTGMILVGLLLWLVFRDIHRVALATSLVVLLFFSYGHVQDVIDPSGGRTSELLLTIGWTLFLVAGLLALAKPREGFARATGKLNFVAACLVILNIVPIVRFEVGGAQDRAQTSSAPVLHIESVDAPKRDIYYLIFDRYAADRTLHDLYDFDNQDFSSWLEDRGFYVADESTGNYPSTTHSLASSLNMTYLDDLAAEVGRDSGDWDPLTDSLDGSAVATSMRRAGYRYYHIGSWWSGTGVDPTADENLVYGAPVRFSDVLFDSTMLPAISRQLGIRDQPSFELEQYHRVWRQFAALEQISEEPASTFTFAHFILPHPPYVFDSDGRFVAPEEAARRSRAEAYLDQLEFANGQIEAIVQTLLAGPAETRPIIILQSDEGPYPIRLDRHSDTLDWSTATDVELGEHMRILNAYFLPGLENPGLYPTISPVNTFRLLFSRYFDADLPLLPDRSYIFEDLEHPYRFTDVTSRLRSP